MSVLVVCTANVCRSPMAAALLGRALRDRGVDAEVTSAGLLFDGRSCPPEVVEVMAGRGLDVSGHSSRIMTAEMVASADLVVCMGREHVREASVSGPGAFTKSLTIKELVRRGETAGPRRRGEDPAAWLGRVGEGRRPTDLLGGSTADDVEDPIGGPYAGYEATAAELEGLCAVLARLLGEAGTDAVDAPPGGDGETRPWGYYAVLEDAPGHKVKRIVVTPGRRLSYQRHRRRDEHWFVVAGRALVTVEGSTAEVPAGRAVDIPRGAAHRVENPGPEDLVFIEVQRGDYFGEDDIIRLEDDYGRVSTPGP